MLHERTEGVNVGNILLFNENTLSKYRIVLPIRKSKELKYSSIVLLKSIETDRGFHFVSYRQFIALSQQQQEKIGEPWESSSKKVNSSQY